MRTLPALLLAILILPAAVPAAGRSDAGGRSARWPFIPIAAPSLPRVRDADPGGPWCRNPIDRFILARLEARRLRPAPAAGRVALLRRLYADLAGVPPSPAEARRFLDDPLPTAYEALVDRLLADPRYGERWGRHWLDLVRYADTDGFEYDNTRPHAWRYRDYVIRSFNADKPYDRFLKEQLAGDELAPGDPDALTATGYARLAPWDEATSENKDLSYHAQRWQDFLNDTTDTTASVMLGLTVGCARCHDHKYDPIPQADYYRLQAFFAPAARVEAPLPRAGDDPPGFRERAAEAEARLAPLLKQQRELREEHRAMLLAEKRKQAAPGANVSVSEGEIDRSLDRREGEKYGQLKEQIERWKSALALYEPVAEAVRDAETPPPATHVLLRGNLPTPGPEVRPGFLTALGGGTAPAILPPPAAGKTSGRRSALAAWIASRDNPLTARVIVNRLWQHHFGRGLVATPSDFGRNGSGASHPELLDWLAARFIADGWSLKRMHRLMLLSSTYRQSTRIDAAAAAADPANRLLGRMNRLRLEGEALRDSILAVSGRLNPEPGGPGVYPAVSPEVLAASSTHKWGSSSEEQACRRTVYVFQKRSLMLPFLESFDGAEMTSTCPKRATTTIAPQALALLNSAFSQAEARHFAARVAKESDDARERVALAYRIALCRPPTPEQERRALDFLAAQTAALGSQPGAGDRPPAELAALADFCLALINSNEFLYLD